MIKEKIKEYHYKAMGKNLQRIRLDKGLSQQDLANICDVETAQIDAIENGAENLKMSTIFDLSIALEVSVSELLTTE